MNTAAVYLFCCCFCYVFFSHILLFVDNRETDLYVSNNASDGEENVGGRQAVDGTYNESLPERPAGRSCVIDSGARRLAIIAKHRCIGLKCNMCRDVRWYHSYAIATFDQGCEYRSSDSCKRISVLESCRQNFSVYANRRPSWACSFIG